VKGGNPACLEPLCLGPTVVRDPPLPHVGAGGLPAESPRDLSCGVLTGTLLDPCWILAGSLTGEFFPTLSQGNIPYGPFLTPKFFPLSTISPLFQILSQILSQRYSFQLFPGAHPETRQHPARDPARTLQDCGLLAGSLRELLRANSFQLFPGATSLTDPV